VSRASSFGGRGHKKKKSTEVQRGRNTRGGTFYGRQITNVGNSNSCQVKTTSPTVRWQHASKRGVTQPRLGDNPIGRGPIVALVEIGSQDPGAEGRLTKRRRRGRAGRKETDADEFMGEPAWVPRTGSEKKAEKGGCIGANHPQVPQTQPSKRTLTAEEKKK